MCSTRTEPRSRTTSSPEYGRSIPRQRGSVAHWCSSSSASRRIRAFVVVSIIGCLLGASGCLGPGTRKPSAEAKGRGRVRARASPGPRPRYRIRRANGVRVWRARLNGRSIITAILPRTPLSCQSAGVRSGGEVAQDHEAPDPIHRGLASHDELAVRGHDHVAGRVRAACHVRESPPPPEREIAASIRLEPEDADVVLVALADPSATTACRSLNGEGLRLVERGAEVGDEPSVAGERGVEVTARSQPDQGPLVAPTCCGAAGEDEACRPRRGRQRAHDRPPAPRPRARCRPRRTWDRAGRPACNAPR